jgi:hypothetical protein
MTGLPPEAQDWDDNCLTHLSDATHGQIPPQATSAQNEDKK